MADAEHFIDTLQSAADRDTPFDVAILDQQMPQLSGIDLARQIRTRPSLAATKLILATSIGLPNPSDEARQVGFDAFVVKPLSRSTLTAALCQVLDITSAAPPVDRERWAPRRDRAVTKALRILVAEDIEINQIVVTAMLDKLGHHAVLTANGYEAVTAALAGDYDLILMDLQMPGMGGAAAAAAIRRAGGRRGTVPIIALTAHAMVEVRAEVLAAGMQDLIRSRSIRRNWRRSSTAGRAGKTFPASLAVHCQPPGRPFTAAAKPSRFDATCGSPRGRIFGLGGGA